MAFCPNCGTQVSEGTKFCTSCGTPLAAVQPARQTQQPPIQQPQVQQAQSQPSSQQNQYGQGAYQQASQQPPSYQQDFYTQGGQGAYQQPQPAQAQYYASPAMENEKYRSLGGWLLFFVVLWGLGALSGLSSFIQELGSFGTLGSYSSGLMLPLLVSCVGIALSVVISTLMVIYIIKRNPSFLRIYQILTIANLVVNAISIIVSGMAVSDSGAAIFAASTGGIVGGIIGLCLMTLYFCKSVRVRTYMESTEYLDRALFKLGAN